MIRILLTNYVFIPYCLKATADARFSFSLSSSSALLTEKMSNLVAEPLLKANVSELGEGPHWDRQNSVLYYVDAFVGDVHRYDIEKNSDTKINLGDLVTIIIPIENDANHLIVSLRNKIIKLNWLNQTHTTIAEVAADKSGLERFNDGKIDAAGRLWIGTVLEKSEGKGVVKQGGSLYKLNGNKFEVMYTKFTLSNGMDWNNNSTLLYFNDSEERITWLFDFDLSAGKLSNQRIFIDFNKETESFAPNEYPDGLVVDSEDFIWIAFFGGGRIVRFNPETRNPVTVVPVGAPETTSLVFGGQSLNDIFVTTGHIEDDDSKGKFFPDAGKIFRIQQTMFQGKPMFNFKA